MSQPRPLAAVFEGNLEVSRAVGVILADRGFAVTSFDERPADLVSTVRSLGADVVVLELAMIGAQGLQAVELLLERMPLCTVLLLSPFDTLREAALAAGAFDLVGNDLRALDRCLARMQSGRTRDSLTQATDHPAAPAAPTTDEPATSSDSPSPFSVPSEILSRGLRG